MYVMSTYSYHTEQILRVVWDTKKQKNQSPIIYLDYIVRKRFYSSWGKYSICTLSSSPRYNEKREPALKNTVKALFDSAKSQQKKKKRRKKNRKTKANIPINKSKSVRNVPRP